MESISKTCRHCGTILPLDGFPINRKTLDGRSSWCKPCHYEAVKRTRAKHRAR